MTIGIKRHTDLFIRSAKIRLFLEMVIELNPVIEVQGKIIDKAGFIAADIQYMSS
jgi:hypothetical protein